MATSIAADALDPVVRQVGEVAGLLIPGDRTDDPVTVNERFFQDPITELGKALSDRQDEVIELLGQIMGQTSGEVLGLPAAGGEDRWIPIQGPAADIGLYLVLRSRGTPQRLYLGLGWRWSVVDAGTGLSVSIRAQLPLLSTDGTGPGTRVDIATAQAPIRLALEVGLAGGFNAPGLRFSGVRGSIAIGSLSTPPDVALVLLGLQLPGEAAARDRSLADLINLPASEWIQMAVALFAAQLQAAAGPGSEAARKVQAVVQHLLPLLGVTAGSEAARLRWEDLPARGATVFDDWLQALVTVPNAMRDWLGHWTGLLRLPLEEAGVTATNLHLVSGGSGTRAEPWHAGLRIGGVDAALTAALENRASGARRLFLGLRVDSTPIPLVDTLRLSLAARAELLAIPLGSPEPLQALPSLDIGLRLHSTGPHLVSHTFPAGDPLAALGQLSVGAIAIGLGLDAQQRPVPLLQLRAVQCARGQWPVLDLSSADAVLDGLGAVAGNAIQQFIEAGLGLADGGTHAGRRIAALMGLVPPASHAAAGAWPVPLLTAADQITAFLGDPLGAIGRYHARCLLADVGGVPGWRHLMGELGELLRGAGLPALPLAGNGSAAAPWRLELASTEAGAVVLRAETALAGGRPQLKLALALEPRALQVDALQLSFATVAELLHLDLATGAAAQARWLPALRANLRLHGALQTPSLGGLQLGAQALSAGLDWRQADGLGWRIALQQPGAQWLGNGRALSLPDLVLDAAGLTHWNLAAPDLGGALGTTPRDAVAELVQYLLGHLMLEHGGPAGFGLSALLGLLPADPGIALPGWRGDATGITLPDDFPRLQPADWGAFFANPLPTLRSHLVAVLGNPRHALPLLRWLGLALQGIAPVRSRAGERPNFEEALGDRTTFPDVVFDEVEADTATDTDAPLSLPTLEDLPFTVEGQGTFEAPYAVGLRAPAARGVQGMVWLDPAGPPTGDALDLAITTLVPALRDLGSLGSLNAEQLAPLLDLLARLDDGAAGALSGVLPAALGNGLRELESFLRTSDGLVLSASQVPPAASGWSSPVAAFEADHVHALGHAGVVIEVRRQLLAWDAANTGPVLLLCAPWAGSADWAAVQAALGGATTTFSFRAPGVAPGAVSTAPLTASRLTVAELSVWDDTPGLVPTARALPMDAPAGRDSQAEQVLRLLQRITALNPGQAITVIAHSASGLAARAALQRLPAGLPVRGLITVGTPHVGTPLPWRSNPPLTEALAVLQRLREQLPLGGAMGQALDALWGFLRERSPAGLAAVWPAQAFAPVGGLSLPAGVPGHAVALRLPGTGLAASLGSAIATSAGQVRTALAARAPVTHIGFGLALAPVVPVSEGLLKLRTSARLDITRLRVAAGAHSRALPRLVLRAELWREGGWLVGNPSARVRVRRAELGCEITEAGIVPRIRLQDVAVDGVEQALATLRRAADTGPWTPDDLLVPALDALLAQLTTGPGLDTGMQALARLLAQVELTRRRVDGAADDSGGYALHPDGWAALLADTPAWLARALAGVLPDAARRETLLTQLRSVLGLSATDLSRLLAAQAGDDAGWRALRGLLQSLGLLEADTRGAVPRIGAWLELLRDPVAWVTQRLRPLLADTAWRSTLLHRLRSTLGVADVGSPVVEVALGGGVALRVEALGRVALRLDGAQLRLVGAGALGGDIALNLSSGAAQLDLRLQPDAVSTGLRLSLQLPAGAASASWALALDFGDGARAAPYASLPLFPVPADLPARLGALLPSLTLNTLASALLDHVLLPRVPQVVPVLQALGLATRPGADDQRPRVRNLARAVADPLGWLQSEQTLFRTNVAGTGLELHPGRVTGLLRDLFATFGLTDTAGDVQLPLNLRLRLVGAPQARVELQTTAPLALAAGVTLGGTFQLGWAASGAFGAGGQLALGAPLPAGSPWGGLVVQAGLVNEAFTLALGPSEAPITLLPFSGFNAAGVGAAAERLLPTLVDAVLRGIVAAAPVTQPFITDLRALAAALQIDSVARLDHLVNHPVAWLRDRLSPAQAPVVVQALLDLIPGAVGVGLSRSAGALRFAPAGAPVALLLGHTGGSSIGLRVDLNADLGPVTLGGAFAVGLPDSGSEVQNLQPVVALQVDASVDDGVIAPGGVSIRPLLRLALGGASPVLELFPLGDQPGSPDFVVRLLPAPFFGVDQGTVEDALLELARRVLVPVAVETLLDTPAVTNWLNSNLLQGHASGGNLRAGQVLTDAGLLVAAGGGYNLVPIDHLVTAAQNPLQLVERLVGATLSALANGLGNTPMVVFGADVDVDGGLYLQRSGTGLPSYYGLRLRLPRIVVAEDPEIIIRIGGETDWIEAAGGPADAGSGFSLLLLKDTGAASGRFAIEPVITLAGVGLDLSGRADEPLFDLSGFQLGGVETLVYLSVKVPLNGAAPTVDFGAYGDLDGIAIPLGTSDSNPVAASLMSGSGGESAPVNPKFSVRAAYVEQFWLELGDTPGRNEVWFPIQRTFGPVSIQQIGVRWIGGPDLKGAILLDGGVALAGLAVGVDDLSLTIPFGDIGDLRKWELGLRGLAVSYDGGGIRIGGGLLEADLPGPDVRYDGFLLVEVGGKSFVALGSYGVVDGDPSLFVFVVIGIPIGGPPYFFITGLAGGFGYNRGLVVPPIEGLPQFPLVAAMSDSSAATAEPMAFLQRMGDSVPMERGSYWFAAGLKFSSFSLVNSQALLYVLLNRGLEIGLLGMSRFELPPVVPLVSVELALKARFSTIEGVISVEARLTDNSWVLSRDCRLTGGFAFFVWFAGEHAGDFVITIGGYHPRYTPPAHYPVVPRLGFNWRVSSSIYIKGEAYFALTPREVMAGGLLEAVYDSGDVRAWFRAWANMYIQWRPFWFEVEIGISIGVSVDTFLGRVKVETGASLIVWGPDIGGEVTVDVWVISITIPFGAARAKPVQILSWDQFRTSLLPPEDDKLFAGGVERGLVSGSPATGPWAVLPEFVLRTETFLGAGRVVWGSGATTAGDRGAFEIDIKPMQRAQVTSEHVVRVRNRQGQDVTHRFHVREVRSGNVPRALWDIGTEQPSRSVIPAYNGARLVASIDEEQLDSTGQIDWNRLMEYSAIDHPLPFARELSLRDIMGQLAQEALLLDQFAVQGSATLWQAQQTVLNSAAWGHRRQTTLQQLAAEGVRVTPSKRAGDVMPRGSFRRGRRNAPPLVRSLHEGLAAEAVPETETRTLAPDPVDEPPRRRIVPMLDAVIRQRVEPTLGRAGSIRTTVGRSFDNALRLDATQMASLLAEPLDGAAVLRQGADTEVRATGLAMTAPKVVRGTGNTRREAAWLDAVGRAAIGGSALVMTTHLSHGNNAGAHGTGASLDPGSTLRFALPTREVEGRPPMLVLHGDGAARVTVLDRAGDPLLDLECSGAQRLELPEGSATVAVTGLGQVHARPGAPGLGAITLAEATQAVPVVGWQVHNELVALTDTTLMARGALLRLTAMTAPLARRGTVRAHDVVDRQEALETLLPLGVRTLVVAIDDGPGDAPADLASGFGLSVRHAVVDESPTLIAAGARTLLVYEVLKTDADAPWMVVSLALSDAWRVAGVMGMQAPPSVWVPLLAEAELEALVEDGPLSATGGLRLQFMEG